MIKSVKYILININIVFLIFITSCSNKEITNIESDLRKIIEELVYGYRL